MVSNDLILALLLILRSMNRLIHSMNCRGKLLDLSTPQVMGIVNLSRNSFYQKTVSTGIDTLINQVALHLEQGASLIDLGAMTSKPGSQYISQDEELKLLIPAVEVLIKSFPDLILSIDTHRSQTAQLCLDKGAHIINDITGGNGDSNMFSLIADYQVPYIMMHMKGEPKNMQVSPSYSDVMLEIIDFFIQKLGQLRKMHIHDVILDPGFGFGKMIEHNYTILNRLKEFTMLDCPILVGVSRKSMINKVLKIKPESALNGTTALHMFALMNGANILRVHDVKAAVECVKLFEVLKEYGYDPFE
jgi:dihydropteroate synthase